MYDVTVPWLTEAADVSGLGPHAYNFGMDSSSASFDILVPNSDFQPWQKMILQVMGYSDVIGTPNNWWLTRKIGAQHPDFPNMRATRITSITPMGPRRKLSVGIGFWGDYKMYRFTILCEQ